MSRLHWTYSVLFCLLALIACDNVNLSLLNKVKRFEPEWDRLSERVSFIDRNLAITQTRYQEDLDEVNPFMSNPRTMERSRLPGLKSEYLNVISQRDSIQDEFNDQKNIFLDKLKEFTHWQTDVMQGDISDAEAQKQLKAYQEEVKEMVEIMDGLQDKTIRNIESHNSILRRLSSALRLYTNYDINPR